MLAFQLDVGLAFHFDGCVKGEWNHVGADICGCEDYQPKQ